MGTKRDGTANRAGVARSTSSRCLTPFVTDPHHAAHPTGRAVGTATVLVLANDHADENHEEVYVLVEGAATVTVDSEDVQMEAGYTLRIVPEATDR